MARSNAARRLRELAVVHVKVAEFLVVSARRIIADHEFDFADAFAAREDLERAA
jgi:hypothetical protein